MTFAFHLAFINNCTVLNTRATNYSQQTKTVFGEQKKRKVNQVPNGTENKVINKQHTRYEIFLWLAKEKMWHKLFFSQPAFHF